MNESPKKLRFYLRILLALSGAGLVLSFGLVLYGIHFLQRRFDSDEMHARFSNIILQGHTAEREKLLEVFNGQYAFLIDMEKLLTLSFFSVGITIFAYSLASIYLWISLHRATRSIYTREKTQHHLATNPREQKPQK
jgi:hypothetical protein